jgi:predicted nucleotidyltransferase
MPQAAAREYEHELAAGRGPVYMKACEQAVLARLRAADDFSSLPGATEGLDRRFLRYASSEPTIAEVLEKVKTKRYAMSRLRRMLMCAYLGITVEDSREPPPYIRVLAMNRTGMMLLKAAREKARLPIITKPASAHRLSGCAAKLFYKEAKATDLYSLAYPDETKRSGGQEWRQTPVVIDG